MTADIVSLARFRRLHADGSATERDVAHWRCRHRDCVVTVGVGQSIVDQLAAFNAVLRARRERPIDPGEVMWCPRHAAEWHEGEQTKSGRWRP